MDLVIGTFNLNNLFDRFNFSTSLAALPSRAGTVTTTVEWTFLDAASPDDPPPSDFVAGQLGVVRIQRNADGRLLKPKPERAQAAIAARIDAMVAQHGLEVLALQEVENIDALRLFNREILAQPFAYEVLLEGNDPRFIDVALLSNLPVENMTSHRYASHPDAVGPIFGRDLLEVDILRPNNRRLVKVFVNHLKSKFVPFDNPNPALAQLENTGIRRMQAETVARIVQARTRSNERFIVLGDMNDAPDSAPLAALSGSGLIDALADVAESQPPPASTNAEDVPDTPRWTSRFSVSRGPDLFDLLDQIWISPALTPKLMHSQIERRSRWNASSIGVGSDHDPVWIRLTGL